MSCDSRDLDPAARRTPAFGAGALFEGGIPACDSHVIPLPFSSTRGDPTRLLPENAHSKRNPTMKRVIRPLALSFSLLVLGASATATRGQGGPPPPPPALPPVPTPPPNPITEAKRVLGKILFWDAQLSSDNTVACGTCHINGSAGADPRVGVHPGLDGRVGTADDVLGSPGVTHSGSDGAYILDAIFGLDAQVTPRSANVTILAAFAPSLFWDGRATGTFTDPESGAVVIPGGGALESQAIAPIMSAVEMGHDGRTWDDVRARLESVRPLSTATDLPPDVAAALSQSDSYPELFTAAFGDAEITATRIAFALATYERTLIADQTPWDLGTMTPAEAAGFQTFLSPGARCGLCHAPPFFTNQTFQNVGLRPWEEDSGRMEFTGDFDDRGRFKVPTLRNAALKSTLMHNGQITDLSDALDFYLEINGHQHFADNQNPLIPQVFIPPQQRPNLVQFLSTGLTDPRVESENFPFDRPTLFTELSEPNPRIEGGAETGSGGFAPEIFALGPPVVGNDSFRVAVRGALGGAEAHLIWSESPPAADGRLVPGLELPPLALAGRGAGNGYGTWVWNVPNDPAFRGRDIYLQWVVNDPAGADGTVRSAVAHLEFFMNDPTECSCPGDANCNGMVGMEDLLSLLAHWGELGGEMDLDQSGLIDFGDLLGVLERWGACEP